MTRALIELAQRVEALRGPDEETDALIRCAVFAPLGSTVSLSPYNGAWCIYNGEDPAGRPRSWEPRGLSRLERLGEFTASIDAAMTLVPVFNLGQKWAVRIDSGFVGPTAELWHECSTKSHHGHAAGNHEAMCRALTAAALRARAANPRASDPAGS